MYPSSSRIFAISTFSFEAGTSTLACFAMTALRRRVSILAIGSVISRVLSLALSCQPSAVSCLFLPATAYHLPAALRHAGNVSLQRELAEAEAAQRELAQVGPGTAAQVAAVPQTDLVLRSLVLF